MNTKIKLFFTFSLVFILTFSLMLNSFAIAQNTLDNNKIASLYLYTKSSFDLLTFPKDDDDLNGAIDEGLAFVEWLRNDDFKPFFIYDNGQQDNISAATQSTYAQTILFEKYTYEQVPYDFGNDSFGQPIERKMVQFKLSKEVGLAFQIMTEIFLKNNMAWGNSFDVDYSGGYGLLKSELYGNNNKALYIHRANDRDTITVGAFRKHTFGYGDMFYFYDSDNNLNCIGNWNKEYGIYKKKDSEYNNCKFITKISYKHQIFENDTWRTVKEYIPFECSTPGGLCYMPPMKDLKVDTNSDGTYTSYCEYYYSQFECEESIFIKYNCTFYINAYHESPNSPKENLFYFFCGANAWKDYYVTVENGEEYTKNAINFLYGNDDDLMFEYRRSGNFDGFSPSSPSSYSPIVTLPYKGNARTYQLKEPWLNSYIGSSSMPTYMRTTMEGIVRGSEHTSSVNGYVDDWLPSTGWDWWSNLGLLVKENGKEFYKISFSVNDVSSDGKLIITSTDTDYKEIVKNAPSEPLFMRPEEIQNDSIPYKNDLVSSNGTLAFISGNIDRILNLEGVKPVVIFMLTLGLSAFVIGRKGGN